MTQTDAPLGSVMPEPPTYRLYTPAMVAAATFFGSALAGAYLLYLNSRRLEDGKGGSNLVVGAVVTLFTLGLAFALPQHVPGTPLGLAAMLAMRYWAISSQGEAVSQHLQAGGSPASRWKVAGVSILACLILAGVVFGSIWATSPSSYKAGADEVLYRHGVQQKEAQALAQALVAAKFFGGTDGVSVYLSRQADTLHVGFVMQEGAWDSSETCEAVRQLGPEISKNAFAGSPVQVEMLNDQGDIKKTL